MMVKASVAAVFAATALAGLAGSAAAQNFDDPKEFQAAKDLLAMTPEGPAGKPWEQHHRRQGSRHLAIQEARALPASASPTRASRIPGAWSASTNMQAQVEVLKNDIKSFTVADAQGKDDKQISDIDAFVSSGNCDALDRFADYHGGADAGGRGRLQEAAGDRVRPRRADRSAR